MSSFFFPFEVNAEERIFKISDKAQIQIEVPKNYSIRTNFLNIPLVILGPQRTFPAKAEKKEPLKVRSVINIYPSGSAEFEFDPKQMKENYEVYQEGRKKWLTKRFLDEWEVLRWFPYEFYERPEGIYHFAGFEFQAQGQSIQDRSLYYFCPSTNEMIFAKSLIYFQNRAKDQKTIDRILKSLRCIE